MRGIAGNAAAPAARCKNLRRGNSMVLPPQSAAYVPAKQSRMRFGNRLHSSCEEVRAETVESPSRFPPYGSPSGILQDHRCAFLPDHDRRSIGVAADNQRHDGGICNAQSSNAMYPQTGIHDRVATRAHSAGADRMQVRDAAIADVLNELLVRPDGGPRHHLFRDIWLERRLFGELSRQPNAADHGIDVMCGFHELELDPRRSERVAACEAHQPATFRTQVNGRHAE